jgi:hypothetical protein
VFWYPFIEVLSVGALVRTMYGENNVDLTLNTKLNFKIKYFTPINYKMLLRVVQMYILFPKISKIIKCFEVVFAIL